LTIAVYGGLLPVLPLQNVFIFFIELPRLRGLTPPVLLFVEVDPVFD